MSNSAEIGDLRRRLARYEKNSRKTSWLLRRLGAKIILFPRDLTRRIRHSLAKRGLLGAAAKLTEMRGLKTASTGVAKHSEAPAGSGHRHLARHFDFLAVSGAHVERLAKLLADSPEASATLDRMRAHAEGTRPYEAQLDEAIALDPNVGDIRHSPTVAMPPWYDGNYAPVSAALHKLPRGPVDNVILVPFGKLGGADFVAGVLARALQQATPDVPGDGAGATAHGSPRAGARTIILRTDQSDWARPDWYPEDIETLDLSAEFGALRNLDGMPDMAARALYLLLQQLEPRRILNVNSRVGFETYRLFGAQLAVHRALYAYYFCADRDEHGSEAGYPVWYLQPILPHLSAAICDTAFLPKRLRARYCMPPALSDRMVTLYTPAMGREHDTAIVHRQVASTSTRTRPRILWANRFDRQKRFDLVVEIAQAMPDIDFHLWGKAVLNKAPDLSGLPANMTIHPPFGSFEELPIGESDGWLYTSAWDGLPTILIECGGMGVPIVASAVDGVPELIDETTGWPVHAANDAKAYVNALRAMLSDPAERIARAETLQARVRDRHSLAAYRAALAPALDRPPAGQSADRPLLQPLPSSATAQVRSSKWAPDISIVLTAHGEGLLAGPTIRSVEAAVERVQNAGASVETLLVLDNADDLTTELLTNALKSGTLGTGARILTTNHGDPAGARNEGVAAAAGQFCAFIDADDLWTGNWLSEALPALRARPDAVFHSACNVSFGDERSLWWHVDSEGPFFDPGYLVWFNYWDAMCIAATKLLLHNPFQPNDIRLGFGHEDWHWNQVTIRAGIPHKPVHGTMHFKRRRSGSQSDRVNQTGGVPWPIITRAGTSRD